MIHMALWDLRRGPQGHVGRQKVRSFRQGARPYVVHGRRAHGVLNKVEAI